MTTANKDDLRKSLRKARKVHVEQLPQSMRGLVFHRPPAPLLDLVPEGVDIGLYNATQHEAPTTSYAQFLFERGHRLSLPRFAEPNGPMDFAHFTDPFEESDLEIGPFGLLQPDAATESLVPGILFVPLVGFTAEGGRLGQGGGHYDRWLAAHPQTTAIGLAWDCQLLDALPIEAHDQSLTAIVTPTRIYGPFE